MVIVTLGFYPVVAFYESMKACKPESSAEKGIQCGSVQRISGVIWMKRQEEGRNKEDEERTQFVISRQSNRSALNGYAFTSM